jgi:Cu2+-containing amine oxidase
MADLFSTTANETRALDPLTPDEIVRITAAVRTWRELDDDVQFVSMTPAEPIRGSGQPVRRRAKSCSTHPPNGPRTSCSSTSPTRRWWTIASSAASSRR